MTNDPIEVVQKSSSLLVFRLSEQNFALNIENVVQIIPMLRLTPVPQIDPIIEGIANIHGELVPVMSVRHHLGLPYLKPSLYTPIVLTRVEDRQMGWIVDEVSGVISVPWEAIIAPATILPEGMENSPAVSGLVYQEDVSILVLDPRFILCPSQYRKINRALPAGIQAAGVQPDPASALQGSDNDFENLHVTRTRQEEGEADLAGVGKIEQPPEPPMIGRKQAAKRSGKANGKKGTILPNTSVHSKPEQPLPQASEIGPIGRSIQAALETQFSVLANEVRKTEKQNDTGA